MRIEVHPDGLTIDGTPHPGLFPTYVITEPVCGRAQTTLTLKTVGAEVTKSGDLLQPPVPVDF